MKNNTFIKLTPNLAQMVRHWRGQKSENDKGGSFNVTLYLDYLEAVNQQDNLSALKRIKTT